MGFTPTTSQMAKESVEETLCAPEIEKNIIGVLIGTRNAYDETKDIINEDCFNDQHYRNIYKCIASIAESGHHPDMVSVATRISEFDKMIDTYAISKLATESECNDIAYHCSILNAYRKKRRAYYLGLQLVNDAKKLDKDIDELTQDTAKQLAEIDTSNAIKDITLRDVIEEVRKDVRSNRDSGGSVAGSRTGFMCFDAKGGLKYSSLIIIAAESSQGKSSLALNLAINSLWYGSKVAFYSMEMTNKELTSRIIACRSGLKNSDILYSSLYDNEISRIDKASNDLSPISGNLHLDDRSNSKVDAIIASIRNKKKRYNIDGAIVDYLQILNVNMRSGGNKEQLMGEISRELKNLAKELNIWIIALSQLSRDRDNPVPSIARIRDSGQIAEAADEVYLIYRPSVVKRSSYPAPFEKVDIKGTAMIMRAKGRNVGTGNWIIGFNEDTTMFYELAETPTMQFEPEEKAPY